LAWLVLHRNRIAAGRNRGQMAITSQMIYARLAVRWAKAQAEEGALAAAERAEKAERQAAS
jgi:NADH:quinone reductase (non-electrogenic)